MNTNIIEWATKNGVKIHPNVRIGPSKVDDPSSGVGVHFTPLENEHNPIELLRIPRHCTYSIATLMDLMKEYESDPITDTIQESLQLFHSQFPRHLLGETSILTLYFSIFAAHEGTCTEFLSKVAEYTNVLLSTDVTVPYLMSEDRYNLYRENYGHDEDQAVSISTSIHSILSKLMTIELAVVKQIYAAIKSRTLEIPQKAEGDDFTVDTTLVPIVDFVNHSINCNAHFDLDKETDDVLLILDTQESSEFEVFIMYDDVEEVNHFVTQYGFIPRSDQPKLYDLPVDREYLKSVCVGNFDLRTFFKWCNLVPNIRFITGKDKIEIDSRPDFCPFSFAFFKDNGKSVFEYDFNRGSSMLAKLLDAEEVDFDCRSALIERESDGCDFNKLVPLVFFYQNKPISDVNDIVNLLDEDTINSALKECHHFIIDYIAKRIETLKAVSSGSDILNEMVKFELGILTEFILNPRFSYEDNIGDEIPLKPIFKGKILPVIHAPCTATYDDDWTFLYNYSDRLQKLFM